MRMLSRLRRAAVFFVGIALASMILTSCPNPPGTGNLRIVLATGDAGPAKTGAAKGLTPVEAGDILALEVTVRKVDLVPEDGGGVVRVFSGSTTVDLMELAGVSRLLSEVSVAEGGYSGAQVELGSALLTLSNTPNEPIALDLAGSGVYAIDFPFDVVPDSGGILYVDFGGLNVFAQDGVAFSFSPSMGVSLRTEVSNVRVEGRIQSVDATGETFSMAVGAATYTVDFSSAEIFQPGDLLDATGTSDDLQADARVAVAGQVGLGDTLSPIRVEILDTPATEEDDRGDRITICHVVSGGDSGSFTVVVGRDMLQTHLDHGDFVGPCDGGEPFALTYGAGAGGSIAGTTPQMVTPGGDGTPVTAVADEGFAFLDWSDGRTDNPRTDINVAADITVTANFVAVFTLEYVAGEGGTLTGAVTQLVPLGSNGTAVTAVRDNGFVFTRWSDGRTDNPRTDREVMADLSISAIFTPRYTLNYTAGPGGSLTGETSQTVLGGADGTGVTAVPAEGFEFTGWSDGNTDNPRTDTAISGNVSVTAEFAERFTLTYTAGANGALSGETVQTVLGGRSGSPVTAAPDDGFGFVMWSDGRTDNPRTDTEISGNVSVSASFATAITLTYLSDVQGTISGSATQIIGVGGTGAAVTAVPNSGFGFVMWSDGRTDNPRVDAQVMSDLTVTASYAEAVSVTYTAGSNGTLTGDTEQVVFVGGDSTPVTAVANGGFAFERWSDGRTDNPRTDTGLSEDLSVTAEFVPAFTLRYLSGEHGAVTGDTEQTIPAGSSGTAVTAVADPGYAFLEWSDGSADNPRTDTDVQADITVTATFSSGVVVTYGAESNGTLTGDTSQLLGVNITGTPVTALPDGGYLFLEWSDGLADNPRVDSNLGVSEHFTAQFFPKPEMITVPAGVFTMGRRDDGDDGTFGGNLELPRHEVVLSEYEIGMFEVTNEEYAPFLNYLNHSSRGLLRRSNGNRWDGHNERIFMDINSELVSVYVLNFGEVTLTFDRNIRKLVPKVKEGLPGGTMYSLADHPVTESTWYGTAIYCNWLSERSGLEPVYDTNTWEADIAKNGYRMPTEAEWERAAAWDGQKHWIYGMTADTLTGRDRANYYTGVTFVPPPDFGNDEFINPLGLLQDSQTAYTSPVGWFNGINVSPNGDVMTVDSRSPAGAYDMSGNVFEWCSDWYNTEYYGVSEAVNPTGPEMGERKVLRGGGWARQLGALRNRTAHRFFYDPTDGDGIVGIRLARSTGNAFLVTLTYSAGLHGTLEGETTQTLEAGQNGTAVTAVPDTGYAFSGWSDGVTDNPRTDLNVAADIAVTANFNVPVTLTYTSGPNGRIDGPSTQTVGAGGTGSAVTAAPDPGFGFLRWDDGRTDNPRTDMDVVADLAVAALFAEAFELQYVAGANGSIEGEGTQVITLGGSGSPVTAVPDEGYGFLQWSDGNTDNPRTDIDVSEDLSVTAQFAERFTLEYAAGENGALSGETAQSVLSGTDGTPVTAEPNQGYSFDQWSDGNTDNPRTDTAVSGNISVTANFVPRVTLVYAAGEHGSVSGELTQELEPGTSGTAVTATPDGGYLFSQWSDGSTENPRTDENALTSLSVTAGFFEIIDMIAVPAGTFTMGRLDTGDDGQYGGSDELPRHDVALSDYEIGRFEITNEQYAVFLNFLLHPSRKLLRREDGSEWLGHNADIYYFNTTDPQKIFAYRLGEVNLHYNQSSGLIEPVTKPGLPEGTVYNMASNPVTEPTWFGAVLYTNWLSERSGLDPVYDTDTWAADFAKNGYRLPTEAEWERAAAWDGAKHWIYGFQSDTLSGRDRCNFHDGPWDPPPDYDNDKFVNPLGLVQDAITPYTSPVGWFNGVNISPNGNVQTVDSQSPVGAYDMSGNQVEWCDDWYSDTYYSVSEGADPRGPATGEEKVARGGAWGRILQFSRQRTAIRISYSPAFTDGVVGFRIAR